MRKRHPLSLDPHIVQGKTSGEKPHSLKMGETSGRATEEGSLSQDGQTCKRCRIHIHETFPQFRLLILWLDPSFPSVQYQSFLVSLIGNIIRSFKTSDSFLKAQHYQSAAKLMFTISAFEEHLLSDVTTHSLLPTVPSGTVCVCLSGPDYSFTMTRHVLSCFPAALCVSAGAFCSTMLPHIRSLFL